MPDQEILVLFNPKSGKGRAQEIASGIANRLSKSNFQIISGKDADETLALLRSKLSSNSLVISVGGDGLFNLALQGIKELGVPIWVWPAGTGNDFWRTHYSQLLHYSKIDTVVDKLNVKIIDTAKVHFDAGSRYFAQVLSAGFDSFVNQRANRLKFIRSSFKYTIATLLEIFRFKPLDYELIIDGKIHNIKAMTVVVANGPSYGGGMLIHPDALPTDGLLNVLVLRPVGKLELLRVFPKIFSGKHMNHPAIETYVARQISIRTSAPVYADGEFFTRDYCRIEVEPNSLKVAQF